MLKKLVPGKNLYQIDRHTCKFLVQLSWACVAGIMQLMLMQ